ncbi:TetR/AcrR family transcriptional regulator [Nocardia australiensis]|uniref:TetR/AcrR family transcriptional regulator n=1 Tax=Nocardia australiensis TaxID=2887191 RepID=UPI001D137D62|nr:TetR family transcriptional regulator [Nocardia australiensis]
MSTTDRRTLIVDAAIDLIATHGIRALTHRALDTELDLPAGSTSYYFRTKPALITAIAARITTRSREDFVAAQFPATGPIDLDNTAHDIAAWLDRLLTERRHHLIVRHALIIDRLADTDLHAQLANSLFSTERARTLFQAIGAADPAVAAADFIAVIEGAVFDRFAGARADFPTDTPESINQLAAVLSIYLEAAHAGS